MNSRFFTALALTAIVIVVTPLLFSSRQQNLSAPASADSTSRPTAPTTRDTNTVVAAVKNNSPKQQLISEPKAGVTTTIFTRSSSYVFAAQGGAPISVVLDSNYRSLRPGIRTQSVELVSYQKALTHYRLILGRDTIALDTMVLRSELIVPANKSRIDYAGEIKGHSIHLSYSAATDPADSYLMHILVTVTNAPPGSAFLVRLPETLPSNERDTVDDINHLAVSYHSAHGDVGSIAFSKLDSLETHTEVGPIDWVATRNKYFLVAFRAEKTPFSMLQLQGAPRIGKVAASIYGSITLPLSGEGAASLDLYVGPQNFERLQRLGSDFDQVNPYAGWLHGVVQPFATIVMKALLWMKHTTKLNYGWVLVLFGVIIRLGLWPLNQSAMRTSMNMQRLQPELQALQKKYNDDPKKQQEAIMKVYKEHGMSPLSPLMGCLPMLLPMPVLFALYYVFQNTIEFRGVPFLWLPDISLRDPFYITPLAMATRLRESGYLSWARYQAWRAEWDAYVATLPSRKGGFATPVSKALSYNGRPFTQLVLEALATNRVTPLTASRYLGLKFEHFGKLREALGEGSQEPAFDE